MDSMVNSLLVAKLELGKVEQSLISPEGLEQNWELRTEVRYLSLQLTRLIGKLEAKQS